MHIGVPKEIKTDEYRVALTPAGARELIQRGHEVVVETTAGEGSAFPDDQYERAGARIVSVDDAWGRADLVLKVNPAGIIYSTLTANPVNAAAMAPAGTEFKNRSRMMSPFAPQQTVPTNVERELS